MLRAPVGEFLEYLVMWKNLLLLVCCLVVIHWGIATGVDRSNVKDYGISFRDSVDSSDNIREKIRSEMDDYKRIKEMMFKNKLLKSSTVKPTTNEACFTITQTSEASTTTVLMTETEATSTEAATESPTTITEASTQSSSEAPAATSSTVRPIAWNPSSDDDSGEDSTTEANYDDTTIMPAGNSSHKVDVGNRVIFSAPTLCKNGRRPDQSGKCRVVI